jgi:3-methyl-2-oxobutanoate hydroxymethyltransferase
VQGKEDDDRARILEEAKRLEQAGAAMVVLEAVPEALAAEISRSSGMITTGIGASAACDGQVLVLYDMLDIYPGRKARFVKNFMTNGATIPQAVKRYVEEVKAGTFPAAEHTFR